MAERTKQAMLLLLLRDTTTKSSPSKFIALYPSSDFATCTYIDK